jgi:hypothetical protein
LGINKNSEFITIPTKINFIASQISLGENHTLLISKSGLVYSCGVNSNGQLGLNNYVNSLFPQLIFDKIISNVFTGVFNSFITTNLYSCNGLSQYDNNICSGNGNCIDNICKCNFGYFGLNCELTTCKEVISTEIPNSGCLLNGKCVGFENCECFFGYTNSNCSEYTCNQISHKLDLGCNNLGKCISYNKCSCYNYPNINSIGSTCSCNEGFSGSFCSIFTCNFFRL